MDSHKEREKALWTAASRYLSGKIDSEQLEAIEKPHVQAFNRALLVLSEQEIRRRAAWAIRRIIQGK